MVRYQIALRRSIEPEPAQAGLEPSLDESKATAPCDETGSPAEQDPATVASESNGQTIEAAEAEGLESEESPSKENPSVEEDESFFDEDDDGEKDPSEKAMRVPEP